MLDALVAAARRTLATTAQQKAGPLRCAAQVKRNVQRTLAVELQRLSVQFRKQQKQYLGRIRGKDGGGAPSGSAASLGLLEERAGARGEDDFDVGFSEAQVRGWSLGGGLLGRGTSKCRSAAVGL